jgi:hypothetical protein
MTSYSVERDFNLSYLQGFLHALACQNVGINHSCFYEIYKIPDAGSAHASFDAYFGSELNERANETLGSWKLEELHQSEQDIYHNIKRVQITSVEAPDIFLTGFFQKWFFEQEYSPVSNIDDCNLQGVSAEFVECIKMVGDIEGVYKVEFDQSHVQYDAVLILIESSYLFIHLGWSD